MIVLLCIGIVLCAVASVICVVYMIESLYTAKIMGRWNWRRTEEIVLGSAALFVFLYLIYILIDIA